MGAGVAGPLVEQDAVMYPASDDSNLTPSSSAAPPLYDALAGVAELLKMVSVVVLAPAVVNDQE